MWSKHAKKPVDETAGVSGYGMREECAVVEKPGERFGVQIAVVSRLSGVLDGACVHQGA